MEIKEVRGETNRLSNGIKNSIDSKEDYVKLIRGAGGMGEIKKYQSLK